MFHSFTLGSVRLPGMSAPYSGWLKVTFFQYLRSNSSLSLALGGLYLTGGVSLITVDPLLHKQTGYLST